MSRRPMPTFQTRRLRPGWHSDAVQWRVMPAPTETDRIYLFPVVHALADIALATPAIK